MVTELKQESEREALRAWFKPKLDEVVQEMLKRKAVTGELPWRPARPGLFQEKCLSPRFGGWVEKTRFVWTISGEDVITDHIPRQHGDDTQGRCPALCTEVADGCGPLARGRERQEADRRRHSGITHG